jgi:hypothetical protein
MYGPEGEDPNVLFGSPSFKILEYVLIEAHFIYSLYPHDTFAMQMFLIFHYHLFTSLISPTSSFQLRLLNHKPQLLSTRSSPRINSQTLSNNI